MKPERYQRIRALFDAVVVLDAAARRAYLQAQENDSTVIAEVLALLGADARHDTEQMARPLRRAMSEAAATIKPGDRLGVWRVAREIAEGGMGAVFLVERDDGHFHQTAALKFIKGAPRAAALEHFARERQLLANLAHPQIARLLDGGATTEGRPYLVMEYIDGVPIDQYCSAQALTLDAILALFVSACDAVAFAHRQLVVHCDIKPSNLLVNTDGRPVLLDFGIAQMMDRVVVDGATTTDADTAAAIAYTPRYASPEQRRGERLTTASDVFSLGTVLRELLTQSPQSGAIDRELQALLAKASHVDARQRYVSVDALCADIGRYRHHQALHAMPSTRAYRLHKFARRRWPWLLAATSSLLIVVAFTSTLLVESQRAHAAEQVALAERDRAVRAEADARASEASALEVSEFLISVFDGANPDADTGTVPTAMLLDQALQRVEQDLVDQPATQAQLYATLGAVQYTIEQAERGRESFERAIAIERTQNRPLVLAQMLNDSAMWKIGHFDGADAVVEAREALDLVQKYAAEDSTLRLDILSATASAIGNGADRTEASALFERAVATARRIAPDSERLSDVLGASGWNQRALGHYDAAIALMRESAALHLRHGSKLDDDYFSGLETLAGTLSLARRFDESEQIFQQVIMARRAAGRLETKYGAWALAEYARMLNKAGRPLEALPLFRQVFAIGERKLADDGSTLAVWRKNFASALEHAGDFESAEISYQESIKLAGGIWGPDSPFVAGIACSHARLLLLAGRTTDAGVALERSRAVLLQAYSADHADVLALRIEYARWLYANTRFDEAATELAMIRPHQAGLTAELAARFNHQEALLLAGQTDLDSALPKIKAAEAALLAALGRQDAYSWLIQLDRAELLQAHGRQREAAAISAEVLAQVEAKLVPQSRLLARLQRFMKVATARNK